MKSDTTTLYLEPITKRSPDLSLLQKVDVVPELGQKELDGLQAFGRVHSMGLGSPRPIAHLRDLFQSVHLGIKVQTVRPKEDRLFLDCVDLDPILCQERAWVLVECRASQLYLRWGPCGSLIGPSGIIVTGAVGRNKLYHGIHTVSCLIVTYCLN